MLKICKTLFLTKLQKILPFSKRITGHRATKTALAECSTPVTFLQEVMFAKSGYNTRRQAPNLLQHHPDTKRILRKQLCHTLLSKKIHHKVFSLKYDRQINNIQPRPENQYSCKRKRKCSLRCKSKRVRDSQARNLKGEGIPPPSYPRSRSPSFGPPRSRLATER